MLYILKTRDAEKASTVNGHAAPSNINGHNNHKKVAVTVTNGNHNGSYEMAERIQRVLTNDPGIGVIRHVDAGYEIADRTAKEENLRVPMRPDLAPEEEDEMKDEENNAKEAEKEKNTQ